MFQVDAVDTNGAGDTFATAYMLAVASHVRSPGAFASWAASRAVMQPQACKPQCVRDALRRDSLSARVFSWLLSRVCYYRANLIVENFAKILILPCMLFCAGFCFMTLHHCVINFT